MMEPSSVDRTDSAICYVLTPRLSADGRVSITLRLYRGRSLASTSPVAVVDRHDAADVMYRCRQHLDRSGVEELSYEAADPFGLLARTDARRTGRLPPVGQLSLGTS